jgi:hypothetical protein
MAAPLAWSQSPPGLHPLDVPQLVAVTFDDNFAPDGMAWATDFFRPLKNPGGAGLGSSFDGTPVRTSFFHNCVYLEDAGTRQAWKTAAQDGHETGNHTVNHAQGAAFTAEQWTNEIAPCTSALSSAEGGVGIASADVHGFRSPYLGYGPSLFGVLAQQGFSYDSSLQSCWGTQQDGKSCPWPYTLDEGSPDALDVTQKFGGATVTARPGLWEFPVSALVVPPDELAAQYGFTAGLRARVPTDMPAPSFYEPATGRIAGLDVTLFVDAGMAANEVLATLKYTLDQRLEGNRAPLVFVAHTHVYTADYHAAAHAPEASGRQGAIEDFVNYALSKPVVRMRPVSDLVSWMEAPQPLTGVVTMPLGGSGGAPSTAGAAGAAGAITTTGGGGTSGSGAAGASTMGGASAGTTFAGTSAGNDAASAAPESATCACRWVGTSDDAWPALVLVLLLGLLAARRRPS